MANVYLYNLSFPYSLISTIPAGTGSGTTVLDFSYDGTYMVVCGGSNNIAPVFDLVAGSSFSTISFTNAQTCKFTPDNKILLTSSTNTVQYFQLDGTSVWSVTYTNCQSS